jgi:hypothetical protein
MIREIRLGVVCESVLDARLGPITRPRRGHRDASMLIPITPGRARPASNWRLRRSWPHRISSAAFLHAAHALHRHRETARSTPG